MALGQTVHRNTVDASVTSARPSVNYADAKQLHLQTSAAYAFLHFNRPFPLGANIVSAWLRVYTKGSWGISPTLTVRRASDGWRANRLTWNNQPAAGGIDAQTTQSSAVDGDEWAFDVTAALQSVSNGADWHGFRIGTDAATAKYLYSGNSATDLQPVLEVTWSTAPQAPTTLTPSGGLAVSVAKPVVSCDFTDHAGSTQMSGIQVQIDPDGSWSSPAFDYTDPDAVVPEVDLAATGYAGLTAGQETRWRVRVQDSSGAWSPWSDPAIFRRDLKGALAFTNPPASGIISEWTPPIAWSLTGETQKAWRLWVAPADDPSDRLYDTEWTKGADTSWTLPKGIIEDDSDYTVVLLVRDSKDRVRTATDPATTRAERTFTFNEDPTPNPVTSLTATNLLPRSRVRLEWDRSTMPDRFAIKRDDKVIEIVDDPNDALMSGTHYGWTDREARPYHTHVYKVQAVVNGTTSGGPTVTIKPETVGVWITDPGTDLDVLISAGKNPASNIIMGEDGTTHFPLRAEHGVRIRQSKRGWESNGPIEGRLIDGYGFTADEWQDRFMRLIERSDDTLVLTIGHDAFKAQVFNMSTPPVGDLPTTHRVSFEFIQTGRLPFKPRQ